MNKTLASMTTAVLLSLSATGMAEDDKRGFYAGVSMERHTLDENFDGVPIDDDSTGYQILAGYRINRFVGFEAAWKDFGEVKGNTVVMGVPASASAEADGFSIAINGYIPVTEKIAIRGQLGSVSWDAQGNINVGGVPMSDSDSGSDVFWGIGADFDLAGVITLYGQYTAYELDDVDFNSIGIGAKFRF